MLLDTHCHLDFLPTLAAQEQCLAALNDAGVSAIAQTLTCSSYAAQRGALQEAGVMRHLSVGLHPWNIETREQVDAELAIFAAELPECRLVGEIGLDFAPRHVALAALQEYALAGLFTQVARQVGAAGGALPVVMSIHAVRSAARVLDLLESTGVAEAVSAGRVVPVFHRFSGTSDDLTRLVRMGGYVSVNPVMLAAKRGRAYVKQVPVHRLLLETDLPEVAGADETPTVLAERIVGALHETVAVAAELRSMGERELRGVMEQTQFEVYGL